MPTDKLFTGQQKELPLPAPDPLGLYNYGARFYSTLTGRFVSPDPLIASPGDPQTLNRYSYVRNNPLIFVDPSGLEAAFVCWVGQDCESLEMGSLEEYQQWVIWYWAEYEGMTLEAATARWDELAAAVGQEGTGAIDILRQFHVLFVNTETEKGLSKYLQLSLSGGRGYADHVEAMLGLIAFILQESGMSCSDSALVVQQWPGLWRTAATGERTWSSWSILL